jgi:hypothetical protein
LLLLLLLLLSYYLFIVYVRIMQVLQLHLGSSSHGGLDVVGLEVALEVEDLAEGEISLDDLLLHEALLLGIGADGGGDLRAAHEGTLGLAEEHAEIIRDLRGLGEDRVLLGLIGTIGGLAVAATLGGLLELTGDALLELLHLREDGGEGLTEGADLANEGVEVSNDIDLGGSGHLRSSSGNRGGNRGRGRGGNRGRSGGRGSGGILLGGSLASSLGGSAGGVHLLCLVRRSFMQIPNAAPPAFNFDRQ